VIGLAWSEVGSQLVKVTEISLKCYLPQVPDGRVPPGKSRGVARRRPPLNAYMTQQVERLLTERDAIKLKVEGMLDAIAVLDVEAAKSGSS